MVFFLVLDPTARPGNNCVYKYSSRDLNDRLSKSFLRTVVINNTQHAVLAEIPLTTHPLQWAEPQNH